MAIVVSVVVALVAGAWDDIVGDVMLQPPPFVDGIEVGWHMRTHVWRRGYATEAARAVIDRALAEFGFWSITFSCSPLCTMSRQPLSQRFRKKHRPH